MTCREKIMSEDFEDILVDYALEQEKSKLPASGYCYQELEKELGILYGNFSYVGSLYESQYRYTYVPKCYGLMQFGALDASYEQIGTYAVQKTPLTLTGKAVLIGFLDTGVRHTLSVFQREDGSSRILSVWDQESMEGVPPKGLLYGRQYLGDTPYRNQLLTENMQAEFLEDETGNLDVNGHGSALISAALSCAPDAYAVVVKCKQAKRYLKRYYAIEEEIPAFAESDLMAGLKYLASISELLQLPMVICFTMGTNMGAHRAYSLLDQYLASLGKKRGFSIVVCGGNEGNAAHHYKGSIVRNPNVESLTMDALATLQEPSVASQYKQVEINVSENVTGFYAELWGSLPALYSLAMVSPDGEEIKRIPIRYGSTQEFAFIYSETRVRIDYSLVERASAQQLIAIRFLQPLAGIWTLRIYTENMSYDGFFHLWLPISSFLKQPVYFLEPDPYETMTEPAYLEEAISLSYYDAMTGAFAVESGRGDQSQRSSTYQRQIPDLAVPGIMVETVFGKQSGASVAAALCAGCVAQFLEWAVTRKQDVLINSRGVRNYFILGAIREAAILYPSPIWGYGRVSVSGIFEALRG